MHSLSVSYDARPEHVIRQNLWRWWTYAVSALVWVIWYVSWTHPMTAEPMRIWVPFVWMFIGYVMGWYFGFKHGVAPLFAGLYSFAKPNVEPEAVLPPGGAVLLPGLECPNCESLSRFHVVSEDDNEWRVKVDCVKCAIHGRTVSEMRVSKK